MRCIATALFLIFYALPVVGQVPTILSSERAQLYDQNSLTIDLLGLQITHSSGEDIEVGCSVCWVPYRGYERLDESVFFELAGKEQLASQARQAKRNRFIAMGLGGLSVIAGATVLSNSFSRAHDGMPKAGPPMLGLVLVGGGSSVIAFSAIKMQSRSVPYSIARDVAFEYNSQLLEELEAKD